MDNIPPFQPGDKIVRITRVDIEYYPGIQQGSIYTVADIWYCCTEYPWRITLVGYSSSPGPCAGCKKVAIGYLASNFRKIPEDENISHHTIESLLEELKQ